MTAKDVKKEYTRPEVASNYDAKRFASRAGKRRNRRKIATINKALALVDNPGLVLDVPCGTGRFYEFLSTAGLKFVGSDISELMLRESLPKARDFPPLALVAADSEALPFKDDSFDVVMSIRYLFHLTPGVRVKILREMGRVAKRYLILDYRLRYSLRNILRIILSRVGLKSPVVRPTRREMLQELADAGLEPVAHFAVASVFSDKHIILCRPAEK